MPVVAIASRKGGVGKSTVCASLAVAAGNATIIDTDPQASLADWAERRGTAPAIIESSPRRVAAAVARASTPWIFIDSQPSAEEHLADVCRAADLVLVVLRPGQFEMDSIGWTLSAVEVASKPAAFVINQAHPQSTLGELISMLEETGYPVAPPLRFRADFAATAAGQTVLESAPDSKAAMELSALWRWVEDHCCG